MGCLRAHSVVRMRLSIDSVNSFRPDSTPGCPGSRTVPASLKRYARAFEGRGPLEQKRWVTLLGMIFASQFRETVE
jgi:hypothetical protein